MSSSNSMSPAWAVRGYSEGGSTETPRDLWRVALPSSRAGRGPAAGCHVDIPWRAATPRRRRGCHAQIFRRLEFLRRDVQEDARSTVLISASGPHHPLVYQNAVDLRPIGRALGMSTSRPAAAPRPAPKTMQCILPSGFRAVAHRHEVVQIPQLLGNVLELRVVKVGVRRVLRLAREPRHAVAGARREDDDVDRPASGRADPPPTPLGPSRRRCDDPLDPSLGTARRRRDSPTRGTALERRSAAAAAPSTRPSPLPRRRRDDDDAAPRGKTLATALISSS